MYSRGTMNSVRVTVNLPEPVVDDLKAIADEREVTRTETVVAALALHKYVHEELKNKSIFLVHHRDGVTRELVFPKGWS